MLRLSLRQLVVCLAAATAVLPAALQGQTADAPLRVFLDCQWRCDQEFLRKEIDYVDWMRDRQDAQLHILVTTQQTGAGGTQFTLDMIGQRSLAGVRDTVRYSAAADDTDDQTRRAVARVIELGLVPFLVRGGFADRLKFSVEKLAPETSDAAPAAGPARDPWNFWTFRLSGNGFLNGNQRNSSRNLNGSLSANRTTDDWKLSLSFSGNQSLSEFQLNDSTEVENRRNSVFSNALAVKSIGDHIAVGARVNAQKSTFSNYDLLTTVAPAIEYSVYPYGESTRRLFTVLYSIGVTHADYEFETIFFRTEETLGSHALTLSYEATQPWGSINVEVERSNYLKDFALNRTEVGGSTNIRLFKGLSFNVGGNYQRIRDQLSLPRKSESAEDVLLQRRQLATGYQYFTHFGLSYRFGSIFNNVVNPRFGNGGGGGGMIIRM